MKKKYIIVGDHKIYFTVLLQQMIGKLDLYSLPCFWLPAGGFFIHGRQQAASPAIIKLLSNCSQCEEDPHRGTLSQLTVHSGINRYTLIRLLILFGRSSMQPHPKYLNWSISLDPDRLLGRGSSGDVYLGSCLVPRPHPVAIKAIPLASLTNEVTRYLLDCEIEALRLAAIAGSSSIVRLYDVVSLGGFVYIVTELLRGGTLRGFIEQAGRLEERTALGILQKLVIGCRVLRDNGVTHRDLKSDNILFSEDPREANADPKLIDFGYCSVECVANKPKMCYNVGSPRYMSPQAYSSYKYSQKSDIWALGVILYEMLTGTHLDQGKDIKQTFQLIKRTGVPTCHYFSLKVRVLLQKMLALDARERASCEEVLMIITESSPKQIEKQYYEWVQKRSDPLYQLLHSGTDGISRTVANYVIKEQRKVHVIKRPDGKNEIVNEPPINKSVSQGSLLSFGDGTFKRMDSSTNFTESSRVLNRNTKSYSIYQGSIGTLPHSASNLDVRTPDYKPRQRLSLLRNNIVNPELPSPHSTKHMNQISFNPTAALTSRI